MDRNDDFPYPLLTTGTQTRIVVLAPGEDIDPIHCFHLTIDLDADGKLHEGAGQSWPHPHQTRETYMKAETPQGGLVKGFTVPNLQLQLRDGQGLHPFQRYTALSYVWGSQTTLHEIFLNGKPFYVGQNLYMALQRLRGQLSVLGLLATPPASVSAEKIERLKHHMLPEGRLLWIDSICINQADAIEREAQVKLMSRIYQQADHVHGDLGYADKEGAHEFLHLLQDIIEAGSACDADQLASAPSRSQGHRSSSDGGITIVAALASQWHNYKSRGTGNSKTVNLPAPAARNLEDHGIPTEDDKAWTYWRRFLDSPYF